MTGPRYSKFLLAFLSGTMLGLVAANRAPLVQATRNTGSAASIETGQSEENATPIPSVTADSRLLATSYPTIEVNNFRKSQTLVFLNIFDLKESANLSSQLSFKSNSDGAADLPASRDLAAKSVFWGNKRDFIAVQLEDKIQISQEYLYISVNNGNASATYRSAERVYHYYDSSSAANLSISLVLAALFMVLACTCWFSGVRQFVLLIRIPQMLFMLNLMAAKPQAANVFSFLDNFRYNLFSIIPNPVIIDELSGIECQPPIQFFAEMLSCHSYNSLKNYVLTFLVYIIMYAFLLTNKFQDREYFVRLRKTMDIHIFMLAILPDVCIAIYLNAVAGLSNSVLSLGFLFGSLLALWYFHIFSSIIGDFYHHNRAKTVEFLRYFIFSRNNLSESDPKLGLKLLAVCLDYLKILVKVTMIALFYNAPKTQMVLIFLAYLFNAAFLVVFRPYTNLFQNIFFAASDVAFFILVVLAFGAHDNFATTATTTKEDKIGGAQSAMVFLIFCFSMFNFFIPILKGNDDSATVVPLPTQTSKEGAKERGNERRPSGMLEKPEIDLENTIKMDQSDSDKRQSKKNILGKPQPSEKEKQANDSRRNSKVQERSEMPFIKDEEQPIKSKEVDASTTHTGKKHLDQVEVHRNPASKFKNDEYDRPHESLQSEDNLLRGNIDTNHGPIPAEVHKTEQSSNSHLHHQPKKNNLIGVSKAGEHPQTSGHVQDHRPHTDRYVDMRSQNKQESEDKHDNHLPALRSGKGPIRRTLKLANTNQHDFEGM